MRHDTMVVRSYAVGHPPGEVTLPGQPGWDTLVAAGTAALEAIADGERWVVPAGAMLRIGASPSRVTVHTGRRTPVRCLYIRRELAIVPSGVAVIEPTPLGTELFHRAVALAPFAEPDAASPERAVLTLLADELTSAPLSALRLPLPDDATARRLADAIQADPAAPLSELLARLPAARRTIERRFAAETGFSPARWRRRARMLNAVDLLLDGVDVTTVGATVGYASPSAFVAAFRSELKTTPGEFRKR